MNMSRSRLFITALAGLLLTASLMSMAQSQSAASSHFVTFSGVVRDDSGNIAPNQRVSLEGGPSGSAAYTGPDGAFEVFVLPGTYQLSVTGGNVGTLPQQYSATTTIDVLADLEQDLTLPSVVLDVTVEDPLGNPVPDVFLNVIQRSTSLELFPGGNAVASMSAAEIQTSEAGQLSVNVFPTNPEGLEVHAYPLPESGFAPESVTGVLVPDDSPITITLSQSTVTFSGVVRDDSGNIAPNQRVSLEGGPSGSAAYTGPDGAFEVFVLPGTYQLSVTGGNVGTLPQQYSATTTIDVLADLEQDLTLPSVVLDVTVEDPLGNPVPDVFLNVIQRSTSLELFPGGNAVASMSAAEIQTSEAGQLSVNVFPTNPEGLEVHAYPLPESRCVRGSVSGVPAPVSTLVVVSIDCETVSAGGPYTVNEGGFIELVGVAADRSGGSNPLTYMWDLDGDGDFGESGADAANGDEIGQSPTLNAVSLDGPNTFEIALSVTSGSGHSVQNGTSVAVLNVAPTVEVTLETMPVIIGSPAVFSVSFTDPAPNDGPFLIQLDFGDGTVTEPLAQAELYEYEYDNPGVFLVTATVIDKDGGAGTGSVAVSAITPGQATEELIVHIYVLGLANGVERSLVARLGNVQKLIEDDNSANDRAACRKITAFMNRVDALRKKGTLVSSDADSLRQHGAAIVSVLNC